MALAHLHLLQAQSGIAPIVPVSPYLDAPLPPVDDDDPAVEHVRCGHDEAQDPLHGLRLVLHERAPADVVLDLSLLLVVRGLHVLLGDILPPAAGSHHRIRAGRRAVVNSIGGIPNPIHGNGQMARSADRLFCRSPFNMSAPSTSSSSSSTAASTPVTPDIKTPPAQSSWTIPFTDTRVADVKLAWQVRRRGLSVRRSRSRHL